MGWQRVDSKIRYYKTTSQSNQGHNHYTLQWNMVGVGFMELYYTIPLFINASILASNTSPFTVYYSKVFFFLFLSFLFNYYFSIFSPTFLSIYFIFHLITHLIQMFFPVPQTFPYEGDSCYMAQCYPYKYSDLQKDLIELSRHSHVHIRPLCLSRAGNACPIITLTENLSSCESSCFL